MVDYSSALPQLQQFQAPNLLAMAQQGQQMQLANLLMQEKQRGFAESNALRDMVAKGVDPTTSEGQRAIIAAAPNAGPAFVKSHLEIQGQERANKTAMAELAIKHAATARSLLPNVNDQAAWTAWRNDLVDKLPGAKTAIPEQFSPAAKENAAMTAEQFIERNKPTIHTAGENIYAVNPYTATGTVVRTPRAPAPTTGELASGMLRKYEGFRETPYFDVNAYRTGYGSDTITKSDGTVVKVQPGMQITREDAERDLSRRLNTEFIPKATAQVGEDKWNALPPQAQAALASVAYNYGSLPSTVVNAVKSGDANAIADAVQALKANPGRRAQEAGDIRSSGQANALAPTGAVATNMLAPGTPISTAKSPATMAAEEAAKTRARETTKTETDIEKAKTGKKEAGEYILRTLGGEGTKKIEDLINASTSGLVEHGLAEAKGAFGKATPGMENIGTLGHIAKQMTFDILNGKLGAGISEGDRKFIEGLTADIANPNKPANERIAGLRQLKSTMEAWASGKNVEIPAPAGITETGAPRNANGRRGTLNTSPAAPVTRPPLSSFGGG